MEIAFITAQVVGALQTVCSAVSVQLKEKYQIIAVMVISGVLLCVVQWLLGRYNGLILTGLGTIIALCAFLFSRKQREMSRWVIGLFAALIILACLLFWQDWYDVFILIAQLTFLAEMSVRKERDLRLLALVNIAFWVIYNITTGGYTLLIGNAIMITSTIIALVRYRKVKNGKTENN